MKTFRGYVSKAQEGILSENPEAREYDSTPTLGEARDRARANTLAWSLRKEDMGVVGDMGDMRATGDAGEKGQARACTMDCAMDLEESTSHASSKGGASGSFADMPSIPDMASSPGGGTAFVRHRGWRLFSTRSLLIALVVNLCLVAAFLFLLRLERGSNEVVFYIDLADQPAKTAATAAHADHARVGVETAPVSGAVHDAEPGAVQDAVQKVPATDDR